MWKNIVEPVRQQMTIWRMPIACWMTKATGALTICNIYSFSTATMFARTRLNIISHVLHLRALSSRHTLSDGTRAKIRKDRTYSVRWSWDSLYPELVVPRRFQCEECLDVFVPSRGTPRNTSSLELEEIFLSQNMVSCYTRCTRYDAA
jgi:hypothetical protein